MYLQEDSHRKIQKTKWHTNEINKNIEQLKKEGSKTSKRNNKIVRHSRYMPERNSQHGSGHAAICWGSSTLTWWIRFFGDTRNLLQVLETGPSQVTESLDHTTDTFTETWRKRSRKRWDSIFPAWPGTFWRDLSSGCTSRAQSHVPEVLLTERNGPVWWCHENGRKTQPWTVDHSARGSRQKEVRLQKHHHADKRNVPNFIAGHESGNVTDQGKTRQHHTELQGKQWEDLRLQNHLHPDKRRQIPNSVASFC